MRRVNNLVASILGRFALLLTAGTPRRCSRILLDLTGLGSDFTIGEIAERGRLGEAHDSDISTTSLLNRSYTNERKRQFVGKTARFRAMSRDGRASGSGRRDAQDRIELFATTVKARGVFAVEAFTRNTAIESIFPVWSSRRGLVTLVDANRTSRLSLFLSLSLFLFLSLSLSHVLSLSKAAGQLCISGQPRGQLFLYFFLILRDHARLPPSSRSNLSGYPSARVATSKFVKNSPHATLLASNPRICTRRDQIVAEYAVGKLTEIFG